MKPVKIGLIGVGGYAQIHLDLINYCENKGICELKSVVIRNPNKNNYKQKEEELKNKGVTIYRSYKEMFDKERGCLDLISIPGGIDQHEEQSIKALESGFNVLCEKPVAGTIKEAVRMREAKDNAGKILAIGFQHIFSPAIQRIKKISLEKSLGRLIKAKTYALGSRDSIYYNRNSWAGKIKVNNRFIYDSPIQNALAHYLNNMWTAFFRPVTTAQLCDIMVPKEV